MKRFFSIICLLVCLDGYSQDHFTLSGTLAGGTAKWIYLRYDNKDGNDILDSARVLEGTFSFSGQINQPSRGILKLNRNPIPDEENLNILEVILVPSKMSAKLAYNAFRNGIVTGSEAHTELIKLRKSIQPLSEKYLILRDSLSKFKTTESSLPANKKVIADLNQSIRLAVVDMWSISYKFIEAHPDSWVSAFELSRFKAAWGIDSIKYLYSQLNDQIKETREAKSILRKITMTDEAKSAIGALAADFSRTDVNGSTITLSDYRGRYVLLDFWGSWCGPCREGNPHLIELYKKFSGDHLEFIGIACQDRFGPWTKAIEKDGIGIWKHVLDLDQKEINETKQKKTIAERFAVNSFPTKILIDRSGKIVARFQGGDDVKLEAKLKELLD
ncbi:redoxin domain-containing protein [Dyadobacter jiangsuensis]